MKHNKKRNTAFLYECLVKELTKCVLREDKKRQNFEDKECSVYTRLVHC